MLSWLIWLQGFSDYLSVTFEEPSATYEGFRNFQESSDAEKFTSEALWNKVGERELILESAERRSRVSVYGMRGQLQAVFGSTLAAGRYFTDGEEAVCLIDEKTAKELFGSRDVTGRGLLLDGEKIQVVGILQGDRDVCVIPAGEGEAFCDVTVRKQRAAQSSDTAVSLIGSYMQGTADRIVDGQLYYILALLKTAGILTAATVIPAVLLIMVKERRLTGAAVLFVGVFILAVLAVQIPVGSDYLPTYWSDFDFFGELQEEKTEQIESLKAHQEFWHEEGFLGVKAVDWTEVF